MRGTSVKSPAGEGEPGSGGKADRKGQQETGTGTGSLAERFDRHGQTVETLLEEMTKWDPGLTPARLQRLGQMVFSRLALEQEDVRAWAIVQRLELQREQFDFAVAKYKETLRSKLRAGLEVLAQAFKQNPEAMKFYEQARALILKETEPTPTEPSRASDGDEGPAGDLEQLD